MSLICSKRLPPMNNSASYVDKLMLERIARRTPAERIRIAASMFDAGKKLIRAGLLAKNKSLSESRIRAITFQRLYSSDFSQSEMQKIMRSIPGLEPDSVLPTSG